MNLPLSLYIHLPWCIRKCPYCDFNSYPLRAFNRRMPRSRVCTRDDASDDLRTLPEKDYIRALLEDLEADVPYIVGRKISSIFIGGGTPSLFSPDHVAYLLEQIKRVLQLSPEIEITLEANPGTVDSTRFAEFRQAGINRLSIGVQSFDDNKLKALGRIHGRQDAIRALEVAHTAGFSNINIDLMFGLPEQTPQDVIYDIQQALSLKPTHVSWYELTIEPNTFFYHHPPRLPDENVLEEIEQTGYAELAKNGFSRYEISAYSKPGFSCQHNLNYWQFGDYLGIGAGAHSKLSFWEKERFVIQRTVKIRNPARYMKQPVKTTQKETLTDAQKTSEFMMNALRLIEGISVKTFEERTGMSEKYIQKFLAQAIEKGLMHPDENWLRPTPRGHRYLNELLALFVV